MDHITPPTNPHYPTPSIPLLTNPDNTPCLYDRHPAGWSSFPSRQGWDKKAMLTHGDFTCGGTRTERECAAMLQAWLYFGLIDEFFAVTGVDSATEFTALNSKGKRAVTTRRLVPCIIAWHQKLRELPAEEHPRILGATVALMEEAYRFLATCLNPAPRAAYNAELDPLLPEMRAPLSPEVVLSIHLLVEELEYARQLADWKCLPGGWNFFDRTSNFLKERFAGGGWCASDVRFLGRFSVATQYFVSLLGPRGGGQAGGHGGCEEWVCRAMDVDEGSYVTKHVEGCRCGAFVAADPEVTGAVLRRGKIPLISVAVTGSADRPVEITVSEADPADTERGPSEPYIAISHVWADGLGNPRANALPACQLLRLQLLVNALGGRGIDGPHTPFWIDTLCVPLTPTSHERNLAIAKLGATYRRATAVLVLDAALMAASSLVSGYELFARILTGAWARRLWTLQEAVFPRLLAIQFLDCAVDMDQVFLQGSHAYQEFKQPAMFLSIAPWYSDIRGHVRSAPEPYPEMLFDLVHLVRCRGTSHPRDEVLCLASLLRFEEPRMRELLAAPEAARRAKFVDMHGTFPRDFVFGAGEKMPLDGYRWCPASFLRHDPASELGHQWDPATFDPANPEASPRPAHRMLTKGPRGLEGTFLGFCLFGEGVLVDDMFNFTDEATGVTYLAKEAKQYSHSSAAGTDDAEEESHWINGLQNAALIADPLTLRKGVVSRAAIVDIVDITSPPSSPKDEGAAGQEGEGSGDGRPVIYARFHRRAWVVLEGVYSAEEREYLEQSEDVPHWPSMEAEGFGEGRTWCLL